MQGHGIKKAVISTLALVLLAACGSAAPVPEDQFYRLSAVMTVAPQSKTLFPGTLEIDRFVADGLTAGRPIVYSEAGKPFQVKEFHYHFWTQPPTVMLRDELVTYLRRAKVADIVVTPEMRVSPDYVLTGKIRRLEKVVGTPPKAVLEIELGLRKASGGGWFSSIPTGSKPRPTSPASMPPCIRSTRHCRPSTPILWPTSQSCRCP